MKKITEKQAIGRCIELWRWVIKTGMNKYFWPKWSAFGHVSHQCFLCEFSEQQGGMLCDKCPYYLRFGYSCFGKEAPWHLYCYTPKPESTKYAKLFLKQLKELKKGTK